MLKIVEKTKLFIYNENNVYKIQGGKEYVS